MRVVTPRPFSPPPQLSRLASPIAPSQLLDMYTSYGMFHSTHSTIVIVWKRVVLVSSSLKVSPSRLDQVPHPVALPINEKSWGRHGPAPSGPSTRVPKLERLLEGWKLVLILVIDK